MKLKEEAEKKKEELLNIVKSSLSEFNVENIDVISQKVIENFADVIPPEVTIQNITLMDNITFIGNGWSKGAKSLKPGNILLNWRKLLIDGAESILTIAGSVSVPWLIPLAGLTVWNKVWSLLNIRIDERHAVVIWVMWHNRDKKNCIEEEKILDLVNKEVENFNKELENLNKELKDSTKPKMSKKELENILKDLEKMECIKKIQNKNKWCLREWVKTGY